MVEIQDQKKTNGTIASTVGFMALLLGVLVYYKLWHFAVPVGVIMICVPIQNCADILIDLRRDSSSR